MAKETFKLEDLCKELNMNARSVRMQLRKLEPKVEPRANAGQRGRAAYVFEGKQELNDVVKRLRDQMATVKRGPKSKTAERAPAAKPATANKAKKASDSAPSTPKPAPARRVVRKVAATA